MKIEITIAPYKIARIFLLIIIFLLTGHILYLCSLFLYGYSYRELLIIFYFDDEGNIPTLYSSIALALASLFLFVIGYLKKKLFQEYLYWLVLGSIFLLLSFDEAASMHEKLNKVFNSIFPQIPDFLSFSWVIPYFFITLFIGLFSLKFIKSLPASTALLFIVSGAIFVSGAIGMEIIGAFLWAKEIRQESILYNISVTLEELLEMLGIVIFNYALLDYFRNEYGDIVTLQFSHSKYRILNEPLKVGENLIN